MNNLIKDIIYSSIKNLFQNQQYIFDNTEYTNFTEWNLSYHFANEISKYIFWLNVDLDVTKRNYEHRRPDIIFHKRRSNALNFLVIELKKYQYDRQDDIKKIKEDWMREPLNYRYGVYVNIWDKDKYKAILFNDQGEKYVINELCNYIQVPNIKIQGLKEYKELTDEILNKDIDLSRTTDLIDNLVLKAYFKDVGRNVV